MLLRNKTICITGGSSGIGRAIAEELSLYNNNICLFARNSDRLSEVKAIIEGNGSNCTVFQGDVKNRLQVIAAACLFKAQYGKIDGAIFSAGISAMTSAKSVDTRLAEEIMATNYFGALYWTEQLLPDMVKQQTGLLAGITALVGFRGVPHGGFYAASKAAFTNYLESIRIELKHEGIQVSTILPGFVETPMTKQYDYAMPFMWSGPKAARYIIRQLEKGKAEIAFAWPIAFVMRRLRSLPPFFYDPIIRLMTTQAQKK